MDYDVKKIAKLSKLTFSETEYAQVEQNFARMLGMIENLPELSGNDTLIDQSNPMQLRKDESRSEFSREELLAGAPQVKAGCVVVPKVVE